MSVYSEKGMDNIYEYIVIGSGPAGVHAAQTLVEAGKNVAVIDVGFNDEHYAKLVPDDDFENIRKNDPSQFRFFLGDKFESINLNDLNAGAQLTPPRKHLIKDVDKFLPVISDTFKPMESLAYGGLGAGWGLGCYVYSNYEIEESGLEADSLYKAYEVISNRIGISSCKDDASEYTSGNLNNILPPLQMDTSIKKLYQKYLQQKEKFLNKNIYFGHPALAMLSVDYKNRRKTEYKDMDFYSDHNWHAYRAWMTIEELRKYPNFRYLNNLLAINFKEENGYVIIEGKDVSTNEGFSFQCKKLLLATGPLGSARIVMRSFPKEISRLPLLCNPYAYVPCINLSMLGKPLERFKSSMGQAVMLYDKDKTCENISSVSLFTYRSLLIHKLIKEAPLNLSDGRKIIQFLQSSFVIAGILHTERFSEKKYLEMVKDESAYTGDKLAAHYELALDEKQKVKSNERIIKSALRSLGCYPAMRHDPGYGSSIHYAGTIPFSEKEEYGTTAFNGKLNQTKNVYIADASGFRFLSAKGITFSIMANAHIVANNAMKEDEC